MGNKEKCDHHWCYPHAIEAAEKIKDLHWEFHSNDKMQLWSELVDKTTAIIQSAFAKACEKRDEEV